MTIVLRVLILFYLMLSPLFAQEYAIVASQKFENISEGKIKAVFMKKTLFLGDTKVIPVNLSVRDTIRSSFDKHILNMSFNRLKTYWSKQHYLGHRPPITMKSQESVKAFVKRVKNAIGYIEFSNVDKDLIILYKWSD